MSTSAGKANRTGQTLEHQVERLIMDRGYIWLPQNRIEAAKILKQPFYTHQFPISKSLYEGKNTRADFILLHPEKHPDFLIIECKWQQGGGTTEEKLPYLVLNIKQNYPYETMVVIDGGGHTKGAIKWIHKQQGGRIKMVCDMAKLMKLANNGFI